MSTLVRPTFKLSSLLYVTREDAEQDVWLQRKFWGDQAITIRIYGEVEGWRIISLLRNQEDI